MKNKSYTGINIQWPISELILQGKKTIETRTYPIPSKYINQEMLLVETPGKQGKFKSRIRAILKFTHNIYYKDKYDFYLDIDKHCVSPDSIWAWKEDSRKIGWELELVKVFKQPIELPEMKKGIIYTKNIPIKY